MRLFLFIFCVIGTLYLIGQVIYLVYMAIKYKRLANKERQEIYNKYVVWIEEQPLM